LRRVEPSLGLDLPGESSAVKREPKNFPTLGRRARAPSDLDGRDRPVKWRDGDGGAGKRRGEEEFSNFEKCGAGAKTFRN